MLPPYAQNKKPVPLFRKRIVFLVGAGGRLLSPQKAFTLFELLVVLVIIGIAASLVVPRLGGGLDKIKLRAAANDIASILRYARSQAVSHGQAQSVIFELGSRQLMVVPMAQSEGLPMGTERSNSDNTIKHYQLPDGLALQNNGSGIESDDTRLIVSSFFSMGNSTGGSFLLKDQTDRFWRIDIDLITGMVSLNR